MGKDEGLIWNLLKQVCEYNHYQPQLTIFKHYQPTIINHCQPFSTINLTNQYEPYVRVCVQVLIGMPCRTGCFDPDPQIFRLLSETSATPLANWSRLEELLDCDAPTQAKESEKTRHCGRGQADIANANTDKKHTSKFPF